MIASMRTPLGYRKRRKRYDEPGHARYLTFSCFHNQSFLKSDRACLWLADEIREAKSKYPFDLWAWVFMPDHVHLLIRPHTGILVGRILRAIKEPVSKRAAYWVRKNAPEFLPRMLDAEPGGGYDHNIVSVAEVREKIGYIHKNPVRRGLATNPGEWKWSSFAAWESGVDEPLPIDRGTLPSL